MGRGLRGAAGPGCHVPKLSSMALLRGARGRRSPRPHTAVRSPSAASSFFCPAAGAPRCRRDSGSPSGSSTWMEKGWCCCSPAAAPWPSQPPRAACGESGRQRRAPDSSGRAGPALPLPRPPAPAAPPSPAAGSRRAAAPPAAAPAPRGCRRRAAAPRLCRPPAGARSPGSPAPPAWPQGQRGARPTGRRSDGGAEAAEPGTGAPGAARAVQVARDS